MNCNDCYFVCSPYYTYKALCDIQFQFLRDLLFLLGQYGRLVPSWFLQLTPSSLMTQEVWLHCCSDCYSGMRFQMATIMLMFGRSLNTWLFFQAFMKVSEDLWDSVDPFLFSVPIQLLSSLLSLFLLLFKNVFTCELPRVIGNQAAYRFHK